MFSILKRIGRTNCNKYYKKDLLLYLKCVEKRNITIPDLNKKIYVIYDNIDDYFNIGNVMLNHDYTSYIKFDNFTYKKIRKSILLKELFIKDDKLFLNKELLLHKLITVTIKLIEIYHLLKVDYTNRVNNFNSNIIKQYIINVVDIIYISVNQI